MKRDHIARWRTNFFTGLAIVLPGIVSLVVVFWLFFTISNITDTLLIFVPRNITHESNGEGRMYWYWSLVALLFATLLVSIVGLLARNFLGKKLIELVDRWLLRVPLLNKIYGATKQINEAFTSGNKSSFKTVVLVEFPRPGMYTVGFLMNDAREEITKKIGRKLVSVFVPMTPNPTGGFLLMLPEDQVTKLDMSVADGIKFIISLGALSPEAPNPANHKIGAGA